MCHGEPDELNTFLGCVSPLVKLGVTHFFLLTTNYKLQTSPLL
jgi:hypothetical protein